MKFQDLTGKTIISAQLMKQQQFDDENFLRLEFSDGTVATISTFLAAYSSDAEDDYPCHLTISEGSLNNLVPVDENADD